MMMNTHLTLTSGTFEDLKGEENQIYSKSILSNVSTTNHDKQQKLRLTSTLMRLRIVTSVQVKVGVRCFALSPFTLRK